jgi:hypothetical protein
MERTIIIPEGAWQRHHETLFPADGREGFLAGLARPCKSKTGLRYIAEELFAAMDADYDYQSRGGLELSRAASSWLNQIGLKAAKYGLAPVHVHSHPADLTNYCSHDNQAEEELHRWQREKGNRS